MGVTKPIFSVPYFFSNFYRMMKTGVAWMISSSYLAGVTAGGKYEHDWKYLTYTFAKSKFPVTEKWTNGAHPHTRPRVVTLSFLYNGNSYTDKMTSLYWNHTLHGSHQHYLLHFPEFRHNFFFKMRLNIFPVSYHLIIKRVTPVVWFLPFKSTVWCYISIN